MAEQHIEAEPARLTEQELEKRLLALGACLQIERARRRLSIENIAKDAKLGHVTWRRVEDGKKVRSSTYAALDEFFELPSGTMQRATAADEDLMVVAKSMNVGIAVANHEKLSPHQFVDRLARSHRIGAVKYGGLRVDDETPWSTGRRETTNPMISVTSSDGGEYLYETKDIEVTPDGVEFRNPPRYQVSGTTGSSSDPDYPTVDSSTPNFGGPDRVLAAAFAEVRGGTLTTAGVHEINKVAPLHTVAGSVASRLLGSTDLTPAERDFLLASLAVMQEAAAEREADH
jgi:hypothetical protein